MKLADVQIITALDPASHARDFSELAVREILQTLFPEHQIDSKALISTLPAISYVLPTEMPCDLSFFLCCLFRENAYRFFSDMIRQWLVPRKMSNLVLQFAVDFYLPHVLPQRLIGAKLSVRCHAEHERVLVARHLPDLLPQLRRGVESSYHAAQMLELRGMSADVQTLRVQEGMINLIKKRPHHFDYDLLADMHTFLVTAKEEFKQQRSVRHLGRIICTHYLFRRALKVISENCPGRRYVSVKLMRADVQEWGSVVGLVIGLGGVQEHEIVEGRHVLEAISQLLPQAIQVDSSYYAAPQRDDGTKMLYLEIKLPEERFTQEHLHLLKQELPSVLMGRVEERVHRLFMPQNEEHIMRHVVTLSGQLQYVRDVPQVIVEFSGQTQKQLEFLVIILRLIRLGQPGLMLPLHGTHSLLEITLDRQEIIGTIRRRYQKEATIVRVRLNKGRFLRQDHAIDLYHARQFIVKELLEMIGEFRDYNGGTIVKEQEVLAQLMRQVGKEAKQQRFLLENFFFHIEPPVMRSLLSPDVLAIFFNLFAEGQREGIGDERYQMRIKDEPELFCCVVSTDQAALLQPLYAAMTSFVDVTKIIVDLSQLPTPSWGLLIVHPDPWEVKKLRYAIEKALFLLT